MKQKYKNIKVTKQYCFDQINDMNETLKQLRERCDHPEEYNELCTYSTRPGQYWEKTTICGICGEVIKFADNIIITEVTSTDND